MPPYPGLPPGSPTSKSLKQLRKKQINKNHENLIDHSFHFQVAIRIYSEKAMHVYSQHLYQWVWGTKHREPVMTHKGQDRLYAYIASILRNKKCHVHKINGTEDHLHIVSSLPPSLDVSGLIKDIKLSTGIFIKKNSIFSDFIGWQEGYGSFTYSKSALCNLVRYVENQKPHHRVKTFREELVELLEEHDVEYDERYLW